MSRFVPRSLKGSKRLEMFKFGLYLSVPVCTLVYWNRPETLEAIITSVRLASLCASSSGARFIFVTSRTTIILRRLARRSVCLRSIVACK